METRDIMLIGVAGLGIAGGIFTNYLIKKNRPAEYYIAKKAESEASMERYRIQCEYDAKEAAKKREYDLNWKKLCNEREAALPPAYWMYKAAIENKEARKYEADKLDKLIKALSDTSNLADDDTSDLSTGLYILAKRTKRDEKLIAELIDIVKQMQFAQKMNDADLQAELVKKVEELKKEDNFEEDLKKLDSLKHDDGIEDFDFDALMHKES